MAPEYDFRKYWDYNIDHLAFYDVKAFIKQIHDIKVDELSLIMDEPSLSHAQIRELVSSKISITFIGHSLGGMVLPMYLIH